MDHWKNLSLLDIEGELWRKIPTHKGIYNISNYGRVKSLSRINGKKQMLKEKILKQSLSSLGYPVVSLWKNGVSKIFFVHILVSKTWFCINHKSGNKTDNSNTNLEMVTHSENNYHSYRVLGRKSGMKGKNGIIRIDSTQIIQKEINGDFIAYHSSITNAGIATNTEPRNIRSCLKNKRNSAGGFVWEYKLE